MADPADDLALALRLADDADALTMQRFGAVDLRVETKPDHTPVSDADRAVEERVRGLLARDRPSDAVVGEEYGASGSGPRSWIVDPVDGTKNFVHGSKDHAVMVGEVRGGEAVRCWIWQPQHEVAYVAERGAGAWRDGERLVRTPVGDDLRGVTSRRSWIGRALGTLRALDLTWICCGVDYPKLVEGAADYALYRKAKPWDHVPGSLLLAEAGGYVGTFDGATYLPQAGTPRGLVAAADRASYDVVRGLLDRLPGV